MSARASLSKLLDRWIPLDAKQVLPREALDHAEHSLIYEPQIGGNLTRSQALQSFRVYPGDNLVVQNCISVLRAARDRMGWLGAKHFWRSLVSPFGDAIPHVVLLRPKEEMLRVDAARIVTGVTNVIRAAQSNAVGYRIGKAVGAPLLELPTAQHFVYPPIPSSKVVSVPLPAAVSRAVWDVFPEPGMQVFRWN